MSAPAHPASDAGAPGAHWQREGLAASFAERRRILIPLLDVQEDVLRRLLARHQRPIVRFLDLGCGAGAMSELVLSALPRSEAVLVDFSAPMLERAGVQLAGYAGRWQAVSGDLNDSAWRDALPTGRYDAIVSGLAIHHLPPERKRTLFAELLALLEPGGVFVNMDYVAIDGPLRGLFDEEMLAAAVRAERDSGRTRAAHEVDLEDDDDRPDTVEDQIRWLRDAGFEQVEVHFKWAEAAVYGGARPAE
ncbi:MAG TPA: class I SAM-dependent methyltransferase [Solirubrobacteraceae bacterium]|jgi:tRNA (cmo5U34)-methyltransferase|nr:class I SAM-dependent methyltransferase [Solirubrobacteraceae bacterium]